MKTEKQKQFLIQAAYYMLVFALLYGALKYLVPVFLPFILAFFLAWGLRRPSAWLVAKLHLPRKLTSILLLTLFYVVFLGLFLCAGWQLLSALRTGIPKLPEIYTGQLLPAIQSLSDYLERMIAQIDPMFVSTIEDLFAQVTLFLDQSISTLSATLMQNISTLVLSLPSLFVKLLIMVISSFFLTGDFERIMQFIRRRIPEKHQSSMKNIRSKLKGSLGIYFRAYALLLCITFLELLIGLFLLRIPYALAVAAVIAVFDLLPILGTGGILIPWAVIAAILKYYPMAVGIVALYLVITVVRNTLEPRLIGKQIGLHPLATLMALFVGGRLFGIVGLFGLPVALSVLVQLRRSKGTEPPAHDAESQPCTDAPSQQ